MDLSPVYTCPVSLTTSNLNSPISAADGFLPCSPDLNSLLSYSASQPHTLQSLKSLAAVRFRCVDHRPWPTTLHSSFLRRAYDASFLSRAEKRHLSNTATIDSRYMRFNVKDFLNITLLVVRSQLKCITHNSTRSGVDINDAE